MILLLQLFLAHIIGDFFLQPKSWVDDKENKKWGSGYLYLHAAVHFLLLVLITGNFLIWKSNSVLWLQCGFIAAIHLVIDGMKLSWQATATKRAWFLADQALHILTILIIWGYTEDFVINWEALTEKKTLVYLISILFILKPTSVIIKNVISKWAPNGQSSQAGTAAATQAAAAATAPAGAVTAQAATAAQAAATTTASASQQAATDTSLKNAGELIGMIERTLVLCFILLGKWEGVGFLLAAKSVFRFGDLKDAKEMKLTEYVLIGTLLSFGIAVLTGILATHLLD